MGDSRDVMYGCEVTLNKESHHLLVLQGGRNKREIESAVHELAKAHSNQHPNLTMEIVKLEVLESPEQMDRWKADLNARYPGRKGAEELFPGNPNAVFFQPLTQNDEVSQSGRADEALIRYLCGG